MGLKPVISLIDGDSEVLKKVRGEKAVVEEAVKIIKNKMTPETPWLALSGDDPEFFDEVVKRFTAEIGYPPAMESFLGCAVGGNTGPKTAAIIIKGENRGPMKYN
jgi:fatty acid-binding protein DegV